MATDGVAVVVANVEEFSEVQRRARYVDGYEIEIIPNTISGYHAGFNLVSIRSAAMERPRPTFGLHRRREVTRRPPRPSPTSILPFG